MKIGLDPERDLFFYSLNAKLTCSFCGEQLCKMELRDIHNWACVTGMPAV